MANYVYKCISVPRFVKTGVKGKDAHETAILAYEKAINKASEDGWELFQTDYITSRQEPGCVAGLFGSRSEEIHFKLLIFRKEK